MTVTDSLKSAEGAFLGVVASILGLFQFGGLDVLAATAGTWFPAIAVSATSLIPNLDRVIAGDAPLHIVVLVVASGVYVAIKVDSFVERLQEET